MPIHLGTLDDEEILREHELRFKTSRPKDSPFDGCIGALDGIEIPIEKRRNVSNPAAYYNRKRFYAIPVQAMVDSDYRFISFSANCVGSTHDSIAHAMSALWTQLSRNVMSPGYWIAADDAYACTA